MTAAIHSRDTGLLLAMCPLLAVSDTAGNALGMGIIVLIAAPLTCALCLIARGWLSQETRLAGALLLFAGVVACIELLARAWFYDLYGALGVFTPLIVANLVIVGALSDADQPAGRTMARILKVSAAMALTLAILGFPRELVGRGSLLHDAGLFFGAWARPFETKVFRVDMGFLLAMLPPSAFISLGVLLALRNWWIHRRS